TNDVVTALLPGATETDFYRKAEMEDVKMVKEQSVSDPAEVAKEGYDALMEGKDKVIVGLKNKMMVGASHLMSDTAVTAYMDEQMQLSDKDKKE
ncbi:MAG TPA: hypothetical protein VHO90_01960, partial [Bacteroidales bacterium]|nr:hypothetical protein [Bacteroidales bacterium]